MTKKDYELIASALAEALGDAQTVGTKDIVKGVQVAIYAVANDLQGQNKNFKHDRFLKDCGVTD